jgi:hypothetical protein
MVEEDVLQVFRDWHQFASSYLQLDEYLEPLDFDSTVSQWQLACDLQSGDSLGCYLNKVFSLTADKEEWQSVLAADNNLWSLCQFIAHRSQRRSAFAPELRLMANNERMFKVLLSRLIERGMPLSSALPSTQLEPYIVQHFELIADTVTELAPGALPRPDLRWKSANPISVVLSFCLIYVMFQAFYRYSASVIGSVLLTAIICILLMKLWDKHHAASYFRNFCTFADLIRLMVIHRNCSADEP